METVIREVTPRDAAALLAFLKQVGGESDNLSFGAEGLPFTAEQEEKFLAQTLGLGGDIMLAAVRGERMVGNLHVQPLSRRFAHRGQVGITVLRECWRQGVGSAMMAEAIARARSRGLEILSLEVRSDNTGAIALYQKFGFERIGTYPRFFKIDGRYYDAELMNLSL